MIRLPALLLVAVLIGAAAPGANAQNAAERRAELALVQEQINDPDPLMRLAYLEEIVAENDPIKIETAIRTAMAIDDPQLRSLAMRAYVASQETIIFDWGYSPGLQAEYDAAAGDERRLGEFMEKYRNAYVHQYAKRATFLFEDFDLSSSSFDVFALTTRNRPDDRFRASGRVAGDRLVFQVPVYHPNLPCAVEITATVELELVGDMRCEGWAEPWPIRAEMF